MIAQTKKGVILTDHLPPSSTLMVAAGSDQDARVGLMVAGIVLCIAGGVYTGHIAAGILAGLALLIGWLLVWWLILEPNRVFFYPDGVVVASRSSLLSLTQSDMTWWPWANILNVDVRGGALSILTDDPGKGRMLLVKNYRKEAKFLADLLRVTQKKGEIPARVAALDSSLRPMVSPCSIAGIHRRISR